MGVLRDSALAGRAGVPPLWRGFGRAYFLKAQSGTRTTSTGKESHRRLWKCAACRRKFSVLVGTIFESSHVPLSKWLLAVYMINSSKNGVAAFEINRTLGVTQKTAWFMMHRIREAMKAGPVVDLFTNTTVAADETYIGGNLRLMHADQRRAKAARGDLKAAVFTLIDTESGEARSRVVPNVTGNTLGAAIKANVDPAGSVLHTDKWKGYIPVGQEFGKHVAVDHSKGEYVKDGAGTNPVENYFSQLKRSIDGTHHHVSREHLPRYLAEFDFRYSTRKESDQERFERLMAQTGAKRLMYRAAAGSTK